MDRSYLLHLSGVAVQTQLHRRNAVYGLIAGAGILQFAICVLLAISHYPGEYSLANNFLSDLGCGATAFGNDNRESAAIFNRSILCLSVALVPYFLVMPSSLPRMRHVLRALGVLSAAGLAGIGLTPYDRFQEAHIAALALWLGPLVVMVLMHLILAALDGRVTQALAWGSAALLVAVALYAEVAATTGHATFLQKVVIVLAAAWFVALLGSVSVETVRSLSSRQEIADRQARAYLQLIGGRLPRRWR